MSHPAVVLPLRHVPGLAALPLAAMVVASLVPDLPMFVPGRGGYRLSHSPLGVVSVDVVVALVLLLVWDRVLRDPLVDLGPRWVRGRLPARARLSGRAWLLAPVAAVLGAASHVVWDAFTHPGRWGVRQVAWLRDEHLGLLGHRWAQYASGVIGLLVVLAAAVAHVARHARRHEAARRRLPAPTGWLALGLVASAGIVGGVGEWTNGLHDVAFRGVVTALQAGLVLVPVVAVLWHVRGRGKSENPAVADGGYNNDRAALH